ncbi:hypothetical protein ROZALSC1DRAFT_29376, partial [Rozella allomycis CSF55]
MVSFFQQVQSLVTLQARLYWSFKRKYFVIGLFLWILATRFMGGTPPSMSLGYEQSIGMFYFDYNGEDSVEIARSLSPFQVYKYDVSVENGWSNDVVFNITSYDKEAKKLAYDVLVKGDGGMLNGNFKVSSEASQYAKVLNQIAQKRSDIENALIGKENKRIDFKLMPSEYESFNMDMKEKFMVFTWFSPLFFIAVWEFYDRLIKEDLEKGLKFGLLMSGMKKSSYFAGVLFIPVTVTLIYSLIAIGTTYSFIKSDVTSVVTCSLALVVEYAGLFMMISQVLRFIKRRSLIFTLMIFIAIFPQVLPIMVYKRMSSLVVYLLCSIPGFSLIYFYKIMEITPFADPSLTLVRVPNYLPSTAEVAIVNLLFGVFYIFIAFYMDWLQVSVDYKRPLLYGITRLFERKVKVVEDEKVLDSKRENSFVSSLSNSEKVCIKNVSKVYQGSSVKALNNINLEFAKNEVFGLIGFNGAGKSTLINILTGTIHATQGSISIFGKDSKRRSEISEKIGICAQYDILYDELTVRDHLEFYAEMKGLERRLVLESIQKSVHELRMNEIIDQKVKGLSGGQKRKVSIAIAFVGNPELV